MVLRFKQPNNMCIQTYFSSEEQRRYLFAWMEKWCDKTTEEWVHLFIHALGPISAACYLDVELHLRTCHSETLKVEFMGTFGLVSGTEALHAALQDIDTVAWGESHLHVAPEGPTWETKVLSMSTTTV